MTKKQNPKHYLIPILTMIFMVASSAISGAEEVAGEIQAPRRQFITQNVLADGTPVSITIVAYPSDESRAQDVINAAFSRVLRLDHELFGENGIQSQINELGKGQPLTLPQDAFDLIAKSVKLAAWTDGWFDVTSASSRGLFVKRDWRRISLNPSERTVKFKSEQMQLDLHRIARGCFVDLAMDEIGRAGFANAMVQVGDIQRNTGHDIYTPWNIKLGFGNDPTTLAYRAQSLGLTNIAVTTVTDEGLGRGLIDPRSRQPVPEGRFKSITIFAADATTATAFALATYTVGPKHGMRFVESHPEVKGIMVDGQGNTVTSEGLKLARPSSTAPARVTADGGPNDLRQKRREEARDL